ncbi:nuclear receptor subfamily 0 group B member 1-like [Saccoglossus kowalevskii]
MFSENKTTIHHGDQQNGTSQSKTSLLRGLLADTATGHLLSGPATNPPQNDAVAVKLTTECQEELNSKLAAWLIRAVQFTKSLPVFYMLNTHDQLVLLNSSWKDLVLLYMAEENYECCVERDESHEPGSTTYQLFSEGIPTHKSVEQLNFALERCRSSRLDLKEYAYLRKIALLNSGKVIVSIVKQKYV